MVISVVVGIVGYITTGLAVYSVRCNPYVTYLFPLKMFIYFLDLLHSMLSMSPAKPWSGSACLSGMPDSRE